jgi:hypothetical protein
MSTAFTRPKTAQAAPVASAIVVMVAAVKPRARKSDRIP